MATTDPIPTVADDDRRWEGVERPYDAEAVEKLRGSLPVEHTLARRGAEKLWQLLHERDYVPALGARTGNQAVQLVQAGLEAIYLCGWQVAADANLAGQTYPDQSLYPVNSRARALVRAHQQRAAARRPDRHTPRQGDDIDWFAPIVADAEAGFGGPLNAFELMKAMIEAGAAGVHFEDQLASREEVRPPRRQGAGAHLRSSIRTLVAARLAADVLRRARRSLVARTDADSRQRCSPPTSTSATAAFLTGERTAEGFFRVTRPASSTAIARGLAYAPYADLRLVRDLHPRPRRRPSASPRRSTTSTRASCSPTTARPPSTGRATSTTTTIAQFQRELGAMGYRFQFITLAGFHSLNHGDVRAGPRLPRAAA